MSTNSNSSTSFSSDTIPGRLFQQVQKRGHEPAYHVRDNGIWVATSWTEYADQVKEVGKALMQAGLESGQTTCILGFNRPEWVIMDLATMAVGAAPAGIYTTCSAEEVQYIIHHAQAPIVLLEDEGQWEKVNAERDNLPDLKKVVMMKGAAKIDDPLVTSWEDFLASGADISDDDFFARLHALEPSALATLIYTSGTTGPPKGVMLSHENLAWTAQTALDLISTDSSDCSLSYLPLSHIAEQMFSLHAPITCGYSVYFAESIDAVPDNLKEVQPTVFFGVPRIWEKFYAGISTKLGDATGIKAKLVAWAMAVGNDVANTRLEGREPTGFLGFKYRLANKLIYSKLKPAIGLGRAKVCVSGAAPIAREILEFFATLDVYVMEVYGQSEDTGPTSFNQPDRFRFGSVGPSVPGVEVKIAESDSEILVRGRNVFMGYFRDEAATNDTLRDGWLHSGDLGSFDEDGFLHITGRKKDIIITAGGKNIAPKNLENGLKNHIFINEAVVIGDRRKYLTVLVTLDPDASVAWAEKQGITDMSALHENTTVRAEVQRTIDELNTHYARVEQLKKFTILARNLSVEDGELTPTLKVKRSKVSEHFADDIEAMYAEDSAASAGASA